MVLAWSLLAGSTAAAAVWAWIAFLSGATGVLEHPLDDAPPEEGSSPVTVVVPGRDEAEHLPVTLRGLLEQDTARPYRVVFVDDASSDATPAAVAELAAAFPGRLVPVRNEEEPPPGWVGKCWAIQRGLAAAGLLADGPVEEASPAPPEAPAWLLFTDADIHFEPDLVRAAVAHAEARDADVLALVPRLVFGSFVERIVQLQLVIALSVMLPVRVAVDPGRPEALTGGAFILTRHRLYAEAGGHAAVRGEVVEDLKLGMKLKAAGAAMAVAVAGDRLWCRMYDGWADQWEGLTKNAYAGLGHSPAAAVGLAAATLVCNVGPALFLPAALALAVSGGEPIAWAATAVAAAAVLLQALPANAARRLCGLPWPYASGVPLGSALYLAILTASVWQSHRGGNRWKGRRYAAPPSAG